MSNRARRNPERIHADLIKLSLAMKAYSDLGGSKRGLDKAEKIITRYKVEFNSMLDTMIEPILEQGLSGISTSSLISQMNRVRVGEVAGQAIELAPIFQEIMGWFNRRLQDLKDAYPDQRTKTALCGIANCCLESLIDLNGLLHVKKASKATTITKWIAMACEETQQANEVEIAISSIGEATTLAEEIKVIDTRIRAGNLTEEEQLSLLEERETKFDFLLDATKNSSNRQAILGEVSRVLNVNTTFQTTTGEQCTLTPEQEEAMMVTGKAIIAAGAGSGKTRVLAAKIAYTINELGVNPSKIIATSFSRKASDELKERADKFSNGRSAEGYSIGCTTHSIARKIIKGTDVFGEGAVFKRNLGHILDEAIEQVQTDPTGKVPNFSPVPFIDLNKARRRPTQQRSPQRPTQQSPAPQGPNQSQYQHQQELKELLRRTVWQIADKAYGAVSGRYNVSSTDWANDDLNALQDAFRINGGQVEVQPSDWNGWDHPGLRQLINRMIQPRGNGAPSRGTKSLQSANPFPGFGGRFAGKKYKKKEPAKPFNMWFNLGLEKMERFQTGDKPMRPADYEKFIGIQKAKLKTPSELWFEGNEDKNAIAVYGAYEHIRLKEKLYNDDDTLVAAAKVLVELPNRLSQQQRQYSHIFVDEAQDLNKCQHTIFGLIAGHLNPQTLEPFGDGSMSADTYCFIGDDKQAIYEFRGADPEEFINQSDSYEGEFKTSVLRTNFRSGRNIVRAANNLIKHNSKQIPMVCNPTPLKEEGSISHISFADDTVPEDDDQKQREDSSPGAEQIASEIKDIVDVEGWRHGDRGEDYKFGIGCRTNKELSGYAIALAMKGIPYYSSRDLLDSASMLAPVDLMSVKSVDPKTRALCAYKITDHLKFYLGKVFNDKLERAAAKARKNPLEFLLDDPKAKSLYGPGDKNPDAQNKNVRKYIRALRKISEFRGDVEDLIDFVCMEVRGVDGKNLLERMGDNLTQEELTALQEETATGEVSEETIEEQALSGADIVKTIFEGKTLDEGMEFFLELKKASAGAKKNTTKDAVFLGTMHSWKGLECRDMYCPMTAGSFPSKMGDIESERRLAYVALTRGQDRVVVVSGKKGPSRFISEGCIRDQDDIRTVNASLSLNDFDFMYAMEQFLGDK